MNKKILAAALLILNSLATGAQAAPEDVTSADPSRWFKADNTPRGRYANHRVEARAAYAQAVAECKAGPRTQARQCRSEAQQAQKEDLARAKRILAHAQGNE